MMLHEGHRVYYFVAAAVLAQLGLTALLPPVVGDGQQAAAGAAGPEAGEETEEGDERKKGRKGEQG